MKAIMIVDIPDNCNKSLLSKTPVSITFNHGTYKTLLYVEGYLKPMPQKKSWILAEKKDGYYEIFAKNYAQGWNDCIDEIIGETE